MIYKKVPGKEPEEIHSKGEQAEELVNSLSKNAYLKHWCYPNPIDIDGDKKEICDLLILFFDTAIIISVKNYDLKGNYERFKKKVIEKSSKQLFGAERKLFKSNRPVKISHSEKGEEIFNPDDYKNIFRITVSAGEDFENYEFIDNKEGKGSVTIFNKETFEIIIQELDTIKDLIEYLKSREDLLLKNLGNKCNCTEKDLLAQFLMNKREFSNELIADFENETESLKTKWDSYIQSKSVFIKKLEDEKSYFIDELIKNDVLKLPNGELLAKELMTLSRFERRIIAQNLFEIVEKNEDKADFLARRFLKYNGIGFLFIYYPIEKTQEEIDFILQKAQELYAYYHNSNKVVLLAASKGLKQWKFGLFQATELNEQIENYLQELAKTFGWFQNEKRTERIIKEYPDE
ncbi:hypothetical protein AX016_0422 [Cellulophaga sp. RHA19]|uniref:hypothetical protein n=1 Tax=Cellulophaga sp. RHA19 TaxID=1798237 RepID=UPI000C2C545E|nr:hypothetical protein [Cellulophaga sp. RHA19]PKB42258.1 hypothetical protein AX016_0422 [Cellulophaga sp. RHA19]